MKISDTAYAKSGFTLSIIKSSELMPNIPFKWAMILLVVDKLSYFTLQESINNNNGTSRHGASY